MQQQHHIMSPEDTVRCQQAIDLAKLGQKQRAYEQFCALHARYPQNSTLLYWIAFTTPYREEAQRTIADIASIEPAHPRLSELQQYVERMQPGIVQLSGYTGPSLRCPYCHHIGPVRITRKIATGGWIWFAAFFLVFFGIMSAVVPIAELHTVECMAFFFLLVGIIGLFLIKKRVYHCGQCGVTFGDAAH